MSLTKYENSYRSQSGEDGIIDYIFKQIGTTSKQLIEVGFDSSCNSYYLLCQGWKGLLIDMNIESINYAKSVDRTGGNMRLLNAWVTRENINELLTANVWGKEPDLLSVDIDGMDYFVWQSINVVDPRVVVVEYNASFGPELSVTVPYDARFHRFRLDPLYHGASLQALTKLAESKGYGLIGCESRGDNAFYVKRDLPMTFVSVQEAFVDQRSRKPWRELVEVLKRFPLEEV